MTFGGPIVNGYSTKWASESFATALRDQWTKVGDEKLGATETEVFEIPLGGSKGKVWFGKADGVVRQTATVGKQGIVIGQNAITEIEINPILRKEEFAHPDKQKANLTQDAMEEMPQGLDMGKHKAGEEIEVEIARGLKMRFCWIPPGKATLGSPESEQNHDIEGGEDEHSYTNNGFWLGKYLVTQEEWHALMGKYPSHFQAAEESLSREGIRDTKRFPVDSVSWDQCQEFLERLSKVDVSATMGTGTFVLPTEDEWEFACRGGKGNSRQFYFGDAMDGTQANCTETYPEGTDRRSPPMQRTTQVGQYERIVPHPWGLCDLHGNLWEWCENVGKVLDLKDLRAKRGGSWDFPASACRSAARFFGPRWDSDKDTGLRVCFRPNVSVR
jgi:formylglycine-generating enzyme required for sulfatase activity